jgi:hypothetical protein
VIALHPLAEVRDEARYEQLVQEEEAEEVFTYCYLPVWSSDAEGDGAGDYGYVTFANPRGRGIPTGLGDGRCCMVGCEVLE